MEIFNCTVELIVFLHHTIYLIIICELLFCFEIVVVQLVSGQAMHKQLLINYPTH